MNVLWQQRGKLPAGGRVDPTDRPINRNPSIGQALKLLDEKQQAPGPHLIHRQDITREDDKLNLLYQRSGKYPLDRPIGRIDQRIAKMPGDLGDSVYLALEMEVTGVNKFKNWTRHRWFPGKGQFSDCPHPFSWLRPVFHASRQSLTRPLANSYADPTRPLARC